MLRRESYAASREMAVDPNLTNNSLINTLGVGWTNGASAAASCNVDIDRELMTAPPPPPNVRTCTLPLLGRVQVIYCVF